MSSTRTRTPRWNPGWNQAHIEALGLSTVQEYREWCQTHGLRVAPEKSWREERDELRLAASLADERHLQRHIAQLGLPDAAAYQAWCRQHGFDDRLDKSPRARRREPGPD